MNIGLFGLHGMNIDGVQFGGFEAAYSRIAVELVQRGHAVTIYCQRARYPRSNQPSFFRGVRLKYMPSHNTKSLATITATLAALVDSFWRERFDIYVVVNVGMGFHCLVAKLFRKTVVLNVDGLDWQRAKWGPLARAYFKAAAQAALLGCDHLIADSRAMQEFYSRNYHRETIFIPYGADIASSTEPSLLERFGVRPYGYYLIVSRLIPENNLDIMIEAFSRVNTNRKLIVAGSATYSSEFHRRLYSMADERVRFIGHVHDPALLCELFCNCFAYLHGHSVGGTNPALLNALGFGTCVLALNTSFNREVLQGDNGLMFGQMFDRSIEDLKDKISFLEDNPDLAAGYRARAPERILEGYRWDRVVEEYEALFRRLAYGERCLEGRATSTTERSSAKPVSRAWPWR